MVDAKYKEKRLQELDWERACKLMPDGVSTLSKMPSRFVEGYPIFADKGQGAYLYSGNRRYIDYIAGLGAILLGYSDHEVNQAIQRQLAMGSIYSLPSRLEAKLAEKLVRLIPCAEQVRFLKNGSDATNAAVRIARAVTGREGIVCVGYNGSADFYVNTISKKKGIPKTIRALSGQTNYNDMDKMTDMLALSNAVEKEVAAVIIEPYIFDEPQDDYLNKLMELAHNNGSLVIFDEVVTGFRTKGFSAQKMFGITPDLACFGKAMANGLPISFVCGKKDYMKELQGDCFISSTFGGELLSIAAALATIKILERNDVIGHIWEKGQILKNSFNEFAEGLDCKCVGYPCRTTFKFPTETHRSLLWQECVKKDILLYPSNFITYAHGDSEIYKTLDALEEAMMTVRNNWDEPEIVLDGRVAKVVLRRGRDT